MCIERGCARGRQREDGLTLIELVMFIVIVSVAIVGVLAVMNVTSSRSADPLVTKQATAIAESLLEEIELQPFTFCDPEDDKVNDATITSSAGCAIPENFGPENGQIRTTYNNVNDYVTAAGVEVQVPIVDVSTNNPITTLSQYAAFVTITNQAVGGVPAADSLRIDVRVTGPGGVNITLTGYRMRYAPNAS